jgi:hypothetical protein
MGGNVRARGFGIVAALGTAFVALGVLAVVRLISPSRA